MVIWPERMAGPNKIVTLFKAAAQLGPAALWPYARYQLALRSGWLRRQTPVGGLPQPADPGQPQTLLQPAPAAKIRRLLGPDLVQKLLEEAGEVQKRRVRLFGGPPRRLDLAPKGRLAHWSAYHSRLPGGGDIKPVWETGRFGWATALARAFWLSGDDGYAQSFWRYFERFEAANPPNCGPHWSSAQEVALRIISWAYCHSLMAGAASSTPARQAALARSLAQHAERIPPSLDYARAQNNNHLLSEGLGLATAAALLPEYPKAKEWEQLGWTAFNEGIARQVHADGAYAQHSSNYHRLMLQLGCWAQVLAAHRGRPLPAGARKRLAAATGWLAQLLDGDSGRAANLGPNDGAYILPLSTLPFADFRPALQAALAAFGGAALPRGPWDELSLWLGLGPPKGRPLARRGPLRLAGRNSWAYLRAAQFKERPGHADQLHLDLWWRGHNIAGDAGSYLYTAAPPWDNALAGTAVHNTLSVDGRDQMTRAGRFLWLDWAQARVLRRREDKHGRLAYAVAEHDGYAHLGIRHRRSVEVQGAVWMVRDELRRSQMLATNRHLRLRWLLPDWKWQLQAHNLLLEAPDGLIELRLHSSVPGLALSLFRAGKRLAGEARGGATLGWVSPSYAVKEPALSLVAELHATPPLTLTTRWMLPD
ncbi:MAG: alginate lyase family protein [Anaerolineales bacterium]|nr:alginate lyase family protein [Anaerolineales bacterium]